MRMHMTLLRSIILYGSERWTMRKTDEFRLVIFETKILRKMYGAVFDSQTNEWRKLHNYEVQMLYNWPDIIKEIAKRRLM